MSKDSKRQSKADLPDDATAAVSVDDIEPAPETGEEVKGGVRIGARLGVRAGLRAGKTKGVRAGRYGVRQIGGVKPGNTWTSKKPKLR